jgi:hypothetical protein
MGHYLGEGCFAKLLLVAAAGVRSLSPKVATDATMRGQSFSAGDTPKAHKRCLRGCRAAGFPRSLSLARKLPTGPFRYSSVHVSVCLRPFSRLCWQEHRFARGDAYTHPWGELQIPAQGIVWTLAYAATISGRDLIEQRQHQWPLNLRSYALKWSLSSIGTRPYTSE